MDVQLTDLENNAFHHVNLALLYDTYHRQPNAKWYGNCGDDTYVHIPYLLFDLSTFNSNTPQWLTGLVVKFSFIADESVALHLDESFPRHLIKKKHIENNSYKYYWQGAYGSGINIISQPIAKAYHDNFFTIMNTAEPMRIHWTERSNYNEAFRAPDIAISFHLALLGFKPKSNFDKEWTKSSFISVVGTYPHPAIKNKQVW